MQLKQSDQTKNIKRIISAFSKMQKLPRTLVRYGIYTFTCIFVIGMVLVILNNTLLQYDPYLDVASKEIVKASFIIAAEAIIGGLVMDYAFKK